MTNQKICNRCIMDDTVFDIRFDENGICNYCRLHSLLEEEYPNDQRGQKRLNNIAEEIRQKGRRKKYDCIVGISGGTDSTYLLWLTKKLGLRPLAVHINNGWDTEISAKNIKNAIDKLNIDLETYSVDWKEAKDILYSFLKSSIPWADGPSDIAITSTLYKAAAKKGINYILMGANFRTEGKQPNGWTYCDDRMVRAIQKKFGKLPLKTFPNLTLFDYFYYGFIKKIKVVMPLSYIDYNKSRAQKMLKERCGWEYYGGHHYESIYTRFIIGWLLPKKFNIDKRKVTFSALIRSGEMTREEALSKIEESPYDERRMQEDFEYVLRRLEVEKEEFESILKLPPRRFTDYPSYYPLFKHLRGFLKLFLRLTSVSTPNLIYYMDLQSKRDKDVRHMWHN